MSESLCLGEFLQGRGPQMFYQILCGTLLGFNIYVFYSGLQLWEFEGSIVFNSSRDAIAENLLTWIPLPIVISPQEILLKLYPEWMWCKWIVKYINIHKSIISNIRKW